MIMLSERVLNLSPQYIFHLFKLHKRSFKQFGFRTKYPWLLLLMHTGPKTLKTSPSNREKSVWPCFAALTSPSQNLALCVHVQEQKNSLSARSNPFPGWGQSLEMFLRVAHKLCLSRDWDTHGQTLFGIRCTAWGTAARVCPAKTLTCSLQKPRDFTPHVKVPSHPLSLIHILISHVSKQAIQITDFVWGNAQHVFGFQKETHASWAYFQYFEDILILQWSKNRSGLTKIVQFHSCTDQLIYVLVSLWFLFLNSWFIWATRRSKNLESSVMRKLTTN